MNNTKTTKRALLSSVIAMLVCITMLIGTTFAWFTDSASTAVNKIQAGNLKIELQYATAWDSNGNPTAWENAKDKTLQFRTADGRTENILWEPGCTYELPAVRIKNNGNLALKYEIAITGIKGDAKLNEAIKWTNGDIDLETGYSGTMIPGQNNNVTAPIVIKGRMLENAGNEYQGLSIDGIGITVFATQYTYESDSFGNIYDTNATYLNQDAQGNYLISNANELVYFAKSVNVDRVTYAGKTVKLTADIDLAGKKWIPVGQTGATQFQGIFDGQNYTIKNMTVNNPSEATDVSSGFFGWIEDHGQGIKVLNVKFDNASVTGSHYVGVVSGYVYGTIENCEVKNSTVIGINMNDDANGDKIGGIVGYVGEDAYIDNNSVMNCSIEGNRDIGGVVGAVANGVDSFSGNTVSDTTIAYETEKTYDSAGKIVSGRTGFAPDATNNATNVTVTKLVTVSTAAELSSALNATYNADTTIKLANNIDLSGEWGAHSLDSSNNANLVIDGNHKTIYGLTSSEYNNINGFDSNGLVTSIKSGLSSVTFKNLTIDGANLTNNGVTYATAGVFVGDINTVNVTFDTCTVKGANVNCYKWAGGFIGYIQDVYGNKSIKLINCVVSDSNINTTDSSVGGLVGQHYTNLTITGCKIMGTTTIKCAENRTGTVAKAGYLLGTATVKTTTISNITVESTVTLNTMGGTTYDTTNYVGRTAGGATVNGVTPNS